MKYLVWPAAYLASSAKDCVWNMGLMDGGTLGMRQHLNYSAASIFQNLYKASFN